MPPFVTCCVSSCPNSSLHMGLRTAGNKNVTYFPFPTDQSMQLFWMQAILKPNLAHVCSNHFLQCDMIPLDRSNPMSQSILKSTAMPVLNLPMTTAIRKEIRQVPLISGTSSKPATATTRAPVPVQQNQPPAFIIYSQPQPVMQVARPFLLTPQTQRMPLPRVTPARVRQTTPARTFQPISAKVPLIASSKVRQITPANVRQMTPANVRQVMPANVRKMTRVVQATAAKTAPLQDKMSPKSDDSDMNEVWIPEVKIEIEEEDNPLHVPDRFSPTMQTGSPSIKQEVQDESGESILPDRSQLCDTCGETYHLTHDCRGTMDDSDDGDSSDNDNILEPIVQLEEGPALSSEFGSKNYSPEGVSLNPKVFSCETCGKNFSSEQWLKNHEANTCPALRKYVCETCQKVFTTKNSLIVHRRLHTGEKPHVCHICGKAYFQSMQLKVHLRTHTGERPYLCETCGKAFPCKTSLNSHSFTHTEKKKYHCSICNKTLSGSKSWLIHRRRHAGVKPHQCKICGNTYFTGTDLKRHMAMHTGEKPMQCTTCGRSFRNKQVLINHIRTHTGEQPYKCEICGRKFTQKVAMTTHLKVHTGEKSFECQTCGRRFALKATLLKHEHIHTRREEQAASRESDSS